MFPPDHHNTDRRRFFMEKMIHTYRLRYLVPFTFPDYRELFRALKKSEDWVITDVRGQQEQDVYSFILDSFSADGAKTRPGSAWLLNRNEKNDRLPIISYRKKGDRPLKLSVTEAGLFLFQSRVGFFWYEIQMGKSITAAKLIEIQNQIRELNRRSNIERFFLISEENIRFEVEKSAVSKEKPGEAGWIFCENPYPCYIRQSAMKPAGVSNDVTTNFPEGAEDFSESAAADSSECSTVDSSESIVADRSAFYDDLEPVRVYPDHKTGNYGFLCNRLRQFTFGSWIAALLYAISPDIVFFTEKRNCLCSGASPLDAAAYPANVPDKAILFTYAVFDAPSADEDSGLQFQEAVFNLTNGYKKSYRMNADIGSDMYRPFQNAVWYATREGCGYFVETAEAAPEFFRHNMKSKVVNDYFILYVILLYQSYSLLRFSRSTAEELSAVPETYASDEGGSIETLQKLNCEINTFLVKGIHTSVSSIGHQNLFFRYVMRALDIESDIRSVTAGLDALLKLQDEIEKQRASAVEKEEEAAHRAADDAMNNSLGLISMLAVISAFTDGLGFVSEIKAILSNGAITPENIVTLSVFALLAVLILRISWPAVKFYWHRHRERKKDKTDRNG